jgi:hypothetical protein
LTAADCLDVDGDDGIIDVVAANVTFNVNAQGAGVPALAITASALDIFDTGSDRYEGFANSINNDLAIITLSEDLPATIPIYDLFRTPLPLDSIITLVGYGTTGNGIEGHIAGTASPFVKRFGQNQVDDASILASLVSEIDEIFLYDFDGPDASTNVLSGLGSGLTLGNQIETTVGPGDSGGPSFLQQGDEWLLVGVNTFGFALPNLAKPDSELLPGTFGTGGGGVLVSTPEKLAWIDSIVNFDTGPAAEPGSLTGVVWQDQDGSGDRDPSEPFLADWLIYLDQNNNGVLDAAEPSTRTDATGTYSFTNLAPGTYTVAQVLPPTWQATFPAQAGSERFRADFSEGSAASLEGFVIDNTGAPAPGLWHLSTGRGTQSGHSPEHSLYFGRNETASGGGDYNIGHTAGRIRSPEISLVGLTSATLSFSHFLNVELGAEVDQARVQVSTAGGPFQTLVAKGPETDALQVVRAANGEWQNKTLDLSAYVGNTIQIQFDFNTVDDLFNRFEGWFVDDVVVRGTGSDRHTVTLATGTAIAGLDFGNLDTTGLPPLPNDEAATLTAPLPLMAPGFLDYGRFLRYQSPTATAPLPPDTIDNLPLALLFDEHFYLQQNPDVAAAVVTGSFPSGYDHFRTHGWAEGRNPSMLYNEAFYVENYGDVAQAIADGLLNSGLEHFLAFGHKEGRTPSARFSQIDYLTQYTDVATAIDGGQLQSAFEHYIRFGVTEDRLPGLLFYSEVDYLQAYPDVALAVAEGGFTDGWEHFIRHGQGEGRHPSDRFSPATYLAANPDVSTAIADGLFNNAFVHFEQFGRFENRPLA